MNTITLMLVDDHDVVRTGLRSFLETQPGFMVIWTVLKPPGN